MTEPTDVATDVVTPGTVAATEPAPQETGTQVAEPDPGAETPVAEAPVVAGAPQEGVAPSSTLPEGVVLR